MNVNKKGMRDLSPTMAPCTHRPILSKRKRTIILPLLSVLKDMRTDQRIIVLQHFDDATRDPLYEVIEHALRDSRLPARQRARLRTKLMPRKHEWRYILDRSGPLAMRKQAEASPARRRPALPHTEGRHSFPPQHLLTARGRG